MKNSRMFFILLLFIAGLSVNVLAVGEPPPVGAPLDGGLLAILGAAGLAYFFARKKKLN